MYLVALGVILSNLKPSGLTLISEIPKPSLSESKPNHSNTLTIDLPLLYSENKLVQPLYLLRDSVIVEVQYI